MTDETNEIIATSKAVEETAKTVGKAIDASSALGKWVGRIFGGLVENGVGLANDRLKYYRLDQLNRIHEKFEAKWKARGLNQAKPLPTGLAIKLLEEASLAEDESLQELWANLLVNGMSPDFEASVERSYVSILAELTSYDAVIFDFWVNAHTPKYFVKDDGKEYYSIPFNVDTEAIEVSNYNLARLGLLTTAQRSSSEPSEFPPSTVPGFPNDDGLRISPLGHAFYRAIS